MSCVSVHNVKELTQLNPTTYKITPNDDWRDFNYIVSGVGRSGTSMMMQILQAGGMDLLYNKNIDNKRKDPSFWGMSGYHPNPNGWFELSEHLEAKDLERLRKKLCGKVIKILNPYILENLLLENSYKIIFMLRDLEEIRLSQQKAFKKKIDYKFFHNGMQNFFKNSLPKILNKKGIETLFVHYKKVLDNPKKEIGRISGFLKFNLNIEEAIKVINPELYRLKI